MNEFFICPNGHRWSPANTAVAPSNDDSQCPFCGAAVDAFAQTPAGGGERLDETIAMHSLPPGLAPPLQPIPELIQAQIGRLCTSTGQPESNELWGQPPAIPDIEILAPLGSGGMGVVWLARQVRLNRTVALKQIAPRLLADPASLTRFQREAQLAAQLQHPNIVQTYEVGEHDGGPFLTLEYVDGGTLAQRLSREPLSFAEAARLAVQMAEAIAFAHQRGVLHRDLKPSNVLLTSEGSPKISDFGLARWLGEAAGDSQTQTALGTPGYMPPEQASGRADARSDVYSLGASLYEMLTGRPPFRGETPVETLHQLTTQEPVPPSRLAARLPRDLETICLKCLEKEPTRRYATADDLAADLRRFLAGEPIQARPLGRIARCLKWARRRPETAALVAVLLVSAIAGTVGVAIYLRTLYTSWKRELALKESALEAQTTAEKRRQQAEANLNLFRESIDRYYTRISEHPRLEDEDLQPLRRELLETARDFYQALVLKSDADPVSEAALARAYWRLAWIESETASNERGRAMLAQALAIQERLANLSNPPIDTQHHFAESLLLDGVLARRLGQDAVAVEQFERARELGESLRRTDPADPRHVRLLAMALSHLGQAARQAGDVDQAERLYLRILELGETARDELFDQIEGRRILAVAHNNLGSLYRMQDRLDETQKHLQRSLDLRVALAAENPDVVSFQRDLGVGFQNLGNFDQSRGDLVAAETAYQNALVVRSQLASGYPHRWSYQSDFAASLNALGIVHHILGQVSEAEQTLSRGLAIRQTLVGREPENPQLAGQLANSLHNLGILFESTDRFAEAEDHFRRALEIDVRLTAEQPRVPGYMVDMLENYDSLGEVCCLAGRPAESLDWIEQGEAALGKLPQRRREDRRMRLAALRIASRRAEILEALGRYDEALRGWDDALQLEAKLKTTPEESGQTGLALQVGRATTLAKTGKIAAAFDALEPALAGIEPNATRAYEAACAYALVAAHEPEDANDDATLQLRTVASDKALALLQTAFANPEFRRSPRFARIYHAPELDALRSRPDFPAIGE